MGDVLDENPEILGLIHADLIVGINPDVGRKGLTAEQTLRALIVKQSNGFSYEELAFHLADSRTYRTFCRLPAFSSNPPTSSALQDSISRIRPETLEAINWVLLKAAVKENIETGRKVRVDCTVTETNIHYPTDSSLLWDAVRVLTRLMHQVDAAAGGSFRTLFTDHTRRAKRRWFGIENAKTAEKRLPLYEDLLKVTRKTLSAAERVIDALTECPELGIIALDFQSELQHYAELTAQVVDQCHRRVIDGEQVPVADKIVSIFEPHTDIIIKKQRETEFGHKLCLTTGASSLVLDCVIEDGNPADTTLAEKMVQRQKQIYGKVPRQTAFDGGFASKDNLKAIKGLGVKDVMFHKKRGMAIADMVKSSWVYRQLKRFRAGIEGNISFLKRCFGLTRCTWKSLKGFKSYVWGSIVSANLLIFARHRMAAAES